MIPPVAYLAHILARLKLILPPPCSMCSTSRFLRSRVRNQAIFVRSAGVTERILAGVVVANVYTTVSARAESRLIGVSGGGWWWLRLVAAIMGHGDGWMDGWIPFEYMY